MAEKVDGRGIGQLMHEEVFAPLHMHDTMFELDRVQDRLPKTRLRRPDGTIVDIPNRRFPPRVPRYAMDGCLNGTAPDYLKFIRMVLNDGQVDGRQFLSASTMRLLRENQVGSLRLPFGEATPESQSFTYGLDPLPGLNIPCTHTAGLVRNEVDVPGRRRAGSLTWAGFFNTHYWIDPTSGIGGVIFCHHHPFNDPAFIGVYERFEKAVYAEFT